MDTVSTLAALAVVAALAAPLQAAPVKAAPACWIEFGSGQVPGAMGAAGAQTPIWRNTVSGVLVRHPKGYVLIDAGWSQAVQAQMAELSPSKRPIGERVLASLAWRKTSPEAFAAAGADPKRLRYVLPTHAHYDHLAGAEELPGPAILLTPEEIAFTVRQEAVPDIVAGSDIRALKGRFKALRFSSEPYLGFPKSHDLYGDGSLVVVSLPGHTPGGIGVFLTVGETRVLHIGDAAWVSEAITRNLPKVAGLRAFADDDGDAADRAVARLHAFQAEHPQIAILPAHDRDAWTAVFGHPGCR